ncbi:MAG: hypothetical protein AAFY38_11325 [Pseudomonadota bacterium]
MIGPYEADHACACHALPRLSAAGLTLKHDAILAPGRSLPEATPDLAQAILEADLPERVRAMGNSNGLGFAITHPGSAGLSVAVHWWAQGSVLCQHFHRAAVGHMTTNRPAIGCVWELDIIAFEARAWRRLMMAPQPEPEAYLSDLAC